MLMLDTATSLEAVASAATPFWDAFWPSLVSTLVGAAIGVPVGLFLNRQAMRLAERRALRTENKLIQRTLAALDSALQYNHEALCLLIDKKKRGTQKLVKPLDTGTWDAVRTLLPASFHDPDLLRRLSYHWVQLDRVTTMHHMILQQQLGANSRSYHPMLSAMQDECDQWLVDLRDESLNLRRDLRLCMQW